MKRMHNGSPGTTQKKPKMLCQYGEKCYRRNPVHFSEYSHPHLDKLYALQKNGGDISLPPGYKAKIDSNVIIDQLQLYRDYGLSVDLDNKTTDKEKNKHNNGQTKTNNVDSPGTSSATTTNVMQKTPKPQNNLNKDQTKITNVVSPGSSSAITKYAMQNTPKPDERTQSQDRRSPVAAFAADVRNSDKPVDMRRQWRDPDSPPKSTSSSKDKSGGDQNYGQGNASSAEVTVNQNNLNKASTEKRGFAARLAAAAPYNFFLTAIRDSPPTHREPLSVCFHQLLDPSMGDLVASLQINFMVELDWLMEQYKAFGHEKKPLFILYGVEDEMLENPKTLPANISVKKVKPSAFGHHHTKMSLFYYKDNSLRVVVSTANLISSDWYNRTQGVWVSPACPELPPDSDTRAGESPTEFKADLLRYMANYQLPALQEWMSRLRKTDFSAIRVCFVSSVPGSHRGPDAEKWGHRRLGHLLRKHAVIPSLLTASKESWPVVAQCSSIGTLGGDPDSWMCGELRNSMLQKCLQPGDMPQLPPPFRVIYPNLRNVKNSHDDLLGGACLPYSRKTHEKQLWFRKFLFEWKSDKRHRTKAIPHIKTYTRVSPCGKHLAWFHLTSANLSKAAWGKLQEPKGKNGATGLYIMSYEAGVLFLPKLLVNEPVFSVSDDSRTSDRNPPFPLPWDLPLSAYDANDEPWFSEYLH